MPENANFTIEFKAATQELRKGMTELRKAQQEVTKNTKQAGKLQADLSKQRIKETKALQDLQKQMMKQQMQAQKQLAAQQKQQNKDQIQHLKAVQKLQGKQTRQQQQQQNRQQRQQQEEKRRRVTGGGLMRAGASVMGGIGGFVWGGMQAGYQKYMQHGQALGGTIGLGSGAGIRRGIRGAPGARLGYSLTDTAGQVPAMGRATGALGPRELQQAMQSTGMQTGEAANIFGVLRRAGSDFAGGQERGQSQGARQFAKIMAAGMETGLEKARLPEFFQTVTSLTEQRGSRAVGRVDATAFAQQMAMLQSTGLEGFKGQRGGRVLQQLSQALQQPGGGEYGEQFIRMAMGFGKPGTGGGTGFYAAEKRREKGLEDPQNIGRLLGEVGTQYGFGQEGALMLREISGVSLEQAEELLKIQESGDTSAKAQETIKKIMEDAKPLEEQSLAAMKGVGSEVIRLATITNRGIEVGKKSAGFIQKIEDLQHEALLWLMQTGKDVHEIFLYIKDWLTSKDEFRKVREEANKVRAHAKTDVSNMTGPELAIHLAENARQGRVLRETTEKATNAGGWFGADDLWHGRPLFERGKHDLRQTEKGGQEAIAAQADKAAQIERWRKKWKMDPLTKTGPIPVESRMLVHGATMLETARRTGNKEALMKLGPQQEATDEWKRGQIAAQKTRREKAALFQKMYNVSEDESIVLGESGDFASAEVMSRRGARDTSARTGRGRVNVNASGEITLEIKNRPVNAGTVPPPAQARGRSGQGRPMDTSYMFKD